MPGAAEADVPVLDDAVDSRAQEDAALLAGELVSVFAGAAAGAPSPEEPEDPEPSPFAPARESVR